MVKTERPDTTRTKPPRRRTLLALLAGFAIVVVATAAGLFWFFGGDAPAAVDLEATAAAVTETTTNTTTAPSDTPASSTTIEGTWTVDTTVGAFSVVEDTTATFAGFRVDEVLNNLGSTTAVGRTPGVRGSIEIEGTNVIAADITVDLTAIVSDRSRRENAIQDALNTSTHPEATFTLTEPIEIGDAAASGEIVTTTAIGELTINGATNAVEILIEAQLVNGMILITGSTDVVFADYDITAPTAPIVLSVEDHGIIELQLWLSQ